MIIRFEGYSVILVRIVRGEHYKGWLATLFEGYRPCVVVSGQAPGNCVADAVDEYHTVYLPERERIRQEFKDERQNNRPKPQDRN